MENIYFIIISLILIAYIFLSIRKNKLSIRASFGWLIFCLIMLFLSIWPKSLDWLAFLLDIAYPPALFLTLCVVILFGINFMHKKEIDELQKKVIDLAQELSIVKEKSYEKRK